MMYVRMNPVHAHLVERPEDWTHGSARGEFILDPMPGKFKSTTSAAKAPFGVGDNVGAKAPTP
jgi:hypothetical protein